MWNRLPLLLFVGAVLFSPPASAIDIQNRLTVEPSFVDLGKEEGRFRENHWGDLFLDGANLQTTLRSELSPGEPFSVVIAPTWISPRAGGDLFFRQGYLRLSLFNLALKVGRDSLWWGPGRHGALLMSNNAFPFDMIQLGSAAPFHLPGFLSGIGSFELHALLTQLERDRDFPHVRLFGLRLEYHPIERVTLGVSRVTMFGGEGRPDLKPWDFPRLYFGKPNRSGKFEVNELAAIDLRFQPRIERLFPGHSIEIYGEYGGEDEAGYLPIKHAVLVGVEWIYEGRRLILEYADNHLPGAPDVWYTHWVYTSGYTYRGNIIGHHMGNDADDLYLRCVSPLIEKWIGAVDLERERHHLSAPIQEKMFRWGGDLTFQPEEGRSYTFRFLSERIDSLNLTSERISNRYGVVTLNWRF